MRSDTPLQRSSIKRSWRARWLAPLSLVASLLSVASCSQDSATPSPEANDPGGCRPPAQACNGAGTGAGGSGGASGMSTTGATAGIATIGGSGGIATMGGTAGVSTTGGTAGIATTGGTAGVSTTGGGAGVDAAGTGGTAGTGGSAGMITGGSAGSGTAGTMSFGGGGQGGSAGTVGTGGGGAGPGVPESATCPTITWPASNGSTNLGSGMSVSGTYDGGMKVHEGNLEDCSTGDQDSVDPLIEVANGGTVKNVIMGNRVGDGIHCLGSCTLENVWFPNVCDDAISIMGSGTVTIKNSGFKNARDKTIQHNGTATVTIDNVYVETAGKLYRSCGEGCSSGTSRTATIQNVVAIGVDQVAGVSTKDTVTLKNICVHRTFSICSIYDPGTSDETETGVNSSNEGPNANCKFTGADTHALLGKVTGIPFTTDSVCGGPNGYKSGSTATNCVAGFDKCLKACMPGGYGFKEISCGSNGRYAEGTGAICAFPIDQTAATNLAQSRVMGASAQVDNNDECSTEWGIALEASNNANYCVCVKKPGYYSHDNWLSWDCQRKWW